MTAICVFCASSEQIADAHKALAAQVGAELARRGHTLVSGGGRVSSMGAVARAARAGGARTVGVVPEALVSLEVADTDADELVVTSTMRQRKAEMDSRAEAFLVLPGGLGTLEELLEIWTARSLGFTDKPLVVLDPGGVYDELFALLDTLERAGFVRPVARRAVYRTGSIDDAFAVLEHGEPPVVPNPAEILEAEL